MKRIVALLLAAALSLSLAACAPAAGQAGNDVQPSRDDAGQDQTPPEEKVFRSADSWLYPSLNPHVDYQGWQEFSYGGIEMLFHIEDDGAVVPWLAESGTVSDDGRIWTIVLRDDVHFSDGDPLTAEMVIANLQDVAVQNGRYAYLQDAVFEAENDTALTITLPEPYLTLVNDLADPDTAIVKMGGGQDVDNAPVSTGPFVVESFTPEMEVVMVKNENYWNGEPEIDRAVFTYVPDPDTQMMAMQNGEISVLNSPTATALEIFGADPDSYTIAYAPTSRLYFYYLNCSRLSENVRRAINLAIRIEDFVTVMGGLVEPAVGPFLSSTEYGKATKPSYDPDAARAAMEEDGYVMNAEGYFEKDGVVPTLNLCYYPARSLDKFAALMQEQLGQVGIRVEVSSYEDPDASYITTGRYDIALYNLIAAPSGDPYYFLNLTMGVGAYNAGGYQNAEIQALLKKMASEADGSARAALGNQIVQMAIDDNAYGYLAQTVKATVLQKGVSGAGESNPYHGGLNVNSRMD